MVDNVSIVAPGIKRYDYPGWKQRYVGAKDALVAAGFAKESWFVGAGERDKRGYTARSKKLRIDGRLVQTTVPAKGSVFVDFHCTEAERQAEREREQAAYERGIQRAAEEKNAVELAWIPDSHERFRQLMLITSRIGLDQRKPLETGLGGYRYSQETIEEFEAAIGEALEILAHGKTLFNPQRQAQKIAEIKARSAKADPGLQRFLCAVASAPPHD